MFTVTEYAALNLGSTELFTSVVILMTESALAGKMLSYVLLQKILNLF